MVRREEKLDCPALDWVTAVRLSRRRGGRIDSADLPVGKKLTLPITPRTAPPSHLQRLKHSLKWSRKYSTRWVDIQEKLLSLQGKDAIGTGVAGRGRQSSGVPRQLAEGKEIIFPLEHRPTRLPTPTTWAPWGQVGKTLSGPGYWVTGLPRRPRGRGPGPGSALWRRRHRPHKRAGSPDAGSDPRGRAGKPRARTWPVIRAG